MKKLWFRCLAVLIGLGACTNAALAQYSSGYSNVGPSAFPIQGNYMQNVPQVPQGYGTASQGYNTAPQSFGTMSQGYNPAHQGYNSGQQVYNSAPQGYGASANTYGANGNYGANYQLVANQGQVYGTAPSVETVPAPQDQSYAPSAIAPNNQMSMQQGAPTLAAPQQNMHTAPTPTPMTYGAPMASSGCATCNQPSYGLDYGSSYGYGYSAASIAPNCTSCGPAPISSCCAPAPIYRKCFAGAEVLFLNRVDTKNKPLSFSDAAYAPDVLTTHDARDGYSAGVQTTIGRYFCCGKYALAATYWGLFPGDETVTRSSATAGTFRSRMPYTYMTMAGTPAAPTTPYAVYDWYDNAYTHSLQRSSQFHNVEVNLLGFAVGCASRNFNMPCCGSMFKGTKSCGGGCGGCGSCGSAGGCGDCCNSCGPSVFGTGPCNLRAPACGSRLNMTWLAGFRWFRFQDDLLYASSLQDTVVNRAADDLYYEVNTLNDLIGFQTGFRMDYCCGHRFNLYTRTKFGVYNNTSSLYTRLGTDYQTAYLNDTRTPTNPDNGQSYLFDVTKNQIAFLSELGTGLGVRINCNWTATFGYQAIVASGVAAAPDNVQTQFAYYDDVRDFHNNSTLILHGFNVGTTYNF